MRQLHVACSSGAKCHRYTFASDALRARAACSPLLQTVACTRAEQLMSGC